METKKQKLTSIKKCLNCGDKTQHDLFRKNDKKIRRCCLCGFESEVLK